MRSADPLRYILWCGVAATAARNRKEYGVPTAWLTHLLGNTVTLFLPDLLRIARARSPGKPPTDSTVRALLRTLDRRVRQDPNYAAYVAPLAIGFIASHPDYSIYHGRWAERTILGFGADSVPHAAAAYALARLVSETVRTLHEELPTTAPLVRQVAWAAQYVDELAAAAVTVVTIIWEVSEYLAHIAELEATGRDASEINMQWSLPDAITDSFSNLLGLLAAIAVRRSKERIRHRAERSGWCGVAAGDHRTTFAAVVHDGAAP
ncbi:MAG: hypothetical protein M3380_17015 [Chloroflexota bacterium]|nr:hypothetical protein [Chloroflexota bacterium]